MTVTSDIRELINAKVSSDVIGAQAVKNGMKTLRETAKRLVLQGKTTIDEMIRLTYEE